MGRRKPEFKQSLPPDCVLGGQHQLWGISSDTEKAHANQQQLLAIWGVIMGVRVAPQWAMCSGTRVLEHPPPYPAYHALPLLYLPQKVRQGGFQFWGPLVLAPLHPIFFLALEPMPTFSFGHWPPQTSVLGSHLDLGDFNGNNQ